MLSLEDFLDAEIEVFESPEYQAEFEQSSVARKNNILFKRLLFDYDEDLPLALKTFIKSNGNEPPWSDLTRLYPELKYVIAEPSTPVSIVKLVLQEITL